MGPCAVLGWPVDDAFACALIDGRHGGLVVGEGTNKKQRCNGNADNSRRLFASFDGFPMIGTFIAGRLGIQD